MPTQMNFSILDLIPARRDTVAGTQTGSDTDLKGYVNPGGRNMKVQLSIGTLSGGTLDCKMQEADSTDSYSDISGAAFAQQSGVTNSPLEVHFRTNKRYVRAMATVGAGATAVYSAHLLVEKRQV